MSLALSSLSIPNQEINKFLTVKKFSETYSLSLSCIYTLIKTDPDFPCFNMGTRKKYYINTALLNEWLNNRTNASKRDRLNIPSLSDFLKR